MADYFVGWGGLALINAALANIDGRGPLKYFLASLLLGPFLTIILAGTREDKDGSLRQIDIWKGRGVRDQTAEPKHAVDDAAPGQ